MEKKTVPKSQSKCHCVNMRRASRSITKFYDQLLEPSGLTITQYSLLSHLRRLGPLTMNQLSEAIRLERTTLVRNLKPLEEIGFVSILSEKPVKARTVQINEEGLKTLEAAEPYWQQAQQFLNELLTEEEITVFKGVLQKLESITSSY